MLNRYATEYPLYQRQISVSDVEYSHLLYEVGLVETAIQSSVGLDSPTHRVGGKVLDGFEKYSHQILLT